MAENILFWNVRGLNAHGHRNTVHELVAAEPISLVCLQETKLDDILYIDVIQLFGFGFDYVFLPAVHT
jgi:exonuclease III